MSPTGEFGSIAVGWFCPVYHANIILIHPHLFRRFKSSDTFNDLRRSRVMADFLGVHGFLWGAFGDGFYL